MSNPFTEDLCPKAQAIALSLVSSAAAGLTWLFSLLR